jgi:hypothetical protein
VFFGQVDKRPKGWYWADTKNEKLTGTIRGPFETRSRRWRMHFIALQVISQEKGALREYIGR